MLASIFSWFAGTILAAASILGLSAPTVPAPSVAAVGAAAKLAIEVELDLPSYLPEAMRHPQHFFSGRKLRITTRVPTDLSSVSFVSRLGARMNNFAINSSEGEEGVLRGAHSPDIRPKARVDSFTVDIPADTPTGTSYVS